MNERLQFKISAELKSVIGKDLITNDFVAIFELVKNSFDAQASRVDVVFGTNENNPEPRCITIVDNGKGMSLDDIKGKWLFVAYSAKKYQVEDTDKRVYAGNKGVGRFSSDRLGRKLRMQTKTKDEDVVHVLDIDWGEFETDPQKLFHEVEIVYGKSDEFMMPAGVRAPDHGVVLEISQLRDPKSWNRKKMLRLKLSLTNLIDPFGDNASPFQIVLKNKYYNDEDRELLEKGELSSSRIVNGVVKNEIFDTLKKKTTKIDVSIDVDGVIETTLTDRGALIYKTNQKEHEYDFLNGVGFCCQIFYLNRSAKATFARRMDMPIKDFGSLFLFRNGFRVFPVGEPDNDFWNIDLRRAQGYARHLGTRDIVGRVDIRGSEEHFKEASSRDRGLVKTPASEQLHEFVIKHCIRALERYVVDVTWQDSLDLDYDTPERMGIDENRARIIELVSKLSAGKAVQVVDYNKSLVSIISEKSSRFESSIKRLFSFAESIQDRELFLRVKETSEKFQELEKQRLEALGMARLEAEAKKRIEEELKGKYTELKQVKDDLGRSLQKADNLEKAYEEERKRSYFLTASAGRDVEQLESFLHQTIIYASQGKHTLQRMVKFDDKLERIDEIETGMGVVLECIEKIIVTSRFATHANFRLESAKVEGDIVGYIEQYLSKISVAYTNRISIQVDVNPPGLNLDTVFTPIELGIVLDNLISNAKKAKASWIKFSVSRFAKNSNSSVVVDVVDNGRGLSSVILDKERVFEKGFTTTRGSGLGLYNSRQYIENMKGDLSLAKEQPQRGAHFVIKLQRA